MSYIHFVLIILVLPACLAGTNPANKNKDAAAYFAGTTPCSNIIRPLHKIAPEPDCPMLECKCMMVEWKLTLYSDPATQQPTHYKLTSINRYVVKETNMYSEPGTKVEREGKWAIIHGTKANPKATIVRLNPDKADILLNFLRLGDNLLHVLDHEGNLLIGDEFFSYTLSRTINQYQ